LRPSRWEIASGVVLGHVARPPHAPPAVADPCVTPLDALEAAVLPALRRPPCLVSFSGGLDSALVLAVAARVARREGLPDPIPVTWRFSAAPRADESAWQDQIVRAVGIESWEILRADDDLDLIGPVARRLLDRHGLLHPVNVHLHLPIVEMGVGGSVLTGAGGDQILAGWHRPTSPTPSGLLRALAHRLDVRRRRPRYGTGTFPWLRPEVAQETYRAYLSHRRREPRRLDRRIAWHTGRRDLWLTCSSLTGLAAEHDVTLVNPLLDDGFLASLTRLAGRRRCPSRIGLLAEIAAGSLPDVVTAPRPKARFLEVFLRAPTREFVSAWDGTGADEELVDPAALRALWSRWPIPGGTAALVQHLWLTTNRPGPSLELPPSPSRLETRP
jgi:hypothetical protein